MKISEIFKKKTVLSYEVFPPKRTSPIATIFDTLDALKGLNPDYISVTYGAGGSDNCQSTLSVAAAIKKYNIESVAHLPCVNLAKTEVLSLLEALKANGIDNILALRGDASAGIQPKLDFKHASDLIAFIKKNGDFNIIGACYPEGHIESGGIINDIRHLKTKVDAGADQLITQLFFDNEYFYAFRDRARHAGIHVPIEAGIMPVVNRRQIERMVTLCGVNLPKKYVKIMEKYEDKPDAMRDAGIAYAIDQIVDLTAQGIDGIHLYTMNNPFVAYKIHAAISSLFAE
jgi:methylenetetrahydrofolate reductase (NADPH)